MWEIHSGKCPGEWKIHNLSILAYTGMNLPRLLLKRQALLLAYTFLSRVLSSN